MIRFHYGPWDQRYYQVLPFLEARNLMKIEKSGSSYIFFLTDKGEELVNILMEEEEFSELASNVEDVSKVLSNITGTKLKNLIYLIFQEEVSEKDLGDLIS